MIPQFHCSLRQAYACADGNRLILSTGKMRRVLEWTGAGLATRSIEELRSQRSWEGQGPGCDWQLPDGSEPAVAEMRELSASVQNDDGFTCEHIAVTAEIAYPSAGVTLRWTAWAYPDAPGIRTRLAAKLAGAVTVPASKRPQGSPHEGRVEWLPHGGKSSRRRFLGYYNGTQQRNDTHLDILKEDVIHHPLSFREWCDWASAACVEDDAGGIALVKESHKCVNRKGHATGGFVCDEGAGLSCTGWGLRPNELSATAFTPGWATWCLVWSGGDRDREVAFKTFDRVRFPIDPRRDLYIQANTWGSTDNGPDARRAAGEESVLRELATCAELGIDVLQIDDGWQVPPGHTGWAPGENGWRPHPASYPHGWSRIRARAAELGVKLGLWAAAQPISVDELKAAFADGGFLQYKLDFADLRSRAEIEALMQKVRDFIAWTGHRVRVNWDVTENEPRYGYFFAREYGCIYLENRKPVRPIAAIYRPHTVLRDLWQVAKYLNLQRFQCSIQNVDGVDRERSDAHLHSHAYATAVALMGIPLFFLETKYYSAGARAEIGALLSVYKKHRASMYQGIVYPIGAKPDNASWTGFQNHIAEEGRGYLLIFRERCNLRNRQSVCLSGVRPGPVRIVDLVRGTARELAVGKNGRINLRMEEAPGFLFLSYELYGEQGGPPARERT